MNNTNRTVVFEPSGKRIGDYQLGQVLGIGGMGTVYLARQISMNRLVALKILHPDLALNETSLKRFFREMRLSANLTTEGVVRVYEAGRDGDIVFFSMEYVEGNNLNSLLRFQRKPFTEDETLEVALFIAKTMSYAWKKYKIVHRDIKPANIVRLLRGGYKLLDLGVSKSLLQNDINSTNITATKFMIGSPAYMSPEQARDAELDCRADIYSLGITMYQLLTTKVPYESPSQFEVIAMHLKSPVPIIWDERADISAPTAALIYAMLAKNPDERPRDWDELYHRIRKTVARRHFLARFAFLKDRKFRFRAAFAGVVTACVILTILITSAVNRVEPQPAESVKTVSAAPTNHEITALREDVIRSLLMQSGKFEQNKDYQSALALWQHYTPPENLRNDTVLRAKIEEQIRYLQDLLRKQNEAESRLIAE